MTMTEILGAVDIGTGSVLCLAVARGPDGSLRELLNESIITSLGAGASADSAIREASMKRTLGPVIDYVDRLRGVGAEHISLVGTSALRRAPNREEFIRDVKSATGLDVDVISGEEEARLTFWGATLDAPAHEGPVIVMDVGGGSSELVLGHLDAERSEGQPPTPEVATSIPIGSLVLTDRYITGYPVSPTELLQLKQGIRDALATDEVASMVSAANSDPAAPLLIAVGGSATTLVAMESLISPYLPKSVHMSGVSADTINKHIRKLGRMSLDERYQVVGLPSGRAPVIDAGLCILHELLKLFGTTAMKVSDKGLRYGVIVRDAARRQGPRI